LDISTPEAEHVSEEEEEDWEENKFKQIKRSYEL